MRVGVDLSSGCSSGSSAGPVALVEERDDREVDVTRTVVVDTPADEGAAASEAGEPVGRACAPESAALLMVTERADRFGAAALPASASMALSHSASSSPARMRPAEGGAAAPVAAVEARAGAVAASEGDELCDWCA